MERLKAMLDAGTDNAMIRYSLGKLCLETGRTADAVEHLAAAITHDVDYSAAWKLYGKALVEDGQPEAAADAYRRGIQVAEARRDVQAAREMQVFLRRLERAR